MNNDENFQKFAEMWARVFDESAAERQAESPDAPPGFGAALAAAFRREGLHTAYARAMIAASAQFGISTENLYAETERQVEDLFPSPTVP